MTLLCRLTIASRDDTWRPSKRCPLTVLTPESCHGSHIITAIRVKINVPISEHLLVDIETWLTRQEFQVWRDLDTIVTIRIVEIGDQLKISHTQVWLLLI